MKLYKVELNKYIELGECTYCCESITPEQSALVQNAHVGGTCSLIVHTNCMIESWRSGSGRIGKCGLCNRKIRPGMLMPISQIADRVAMRFFAGFCLGAASGFAGGMKNVLFLSHSAFVQGRKFASHFENGQFASELLEIGETATRDVHEVVEPLTLVLRNKAPDLGCKREWIIGAEISMMGTVLILCLVCGYDLQKALKDATLSLGIILGLAAILYDMKALFVS